MSARYPLQAMNTSGVTKTASIGRYNLASVSLPLPISANPLNLKKEKFHRNRSKARAYRHLRWPRKELISSVPSKKIKRTLTSPPINHKSSQEKSYPLATMIVEPANQEYESVKRPWLSRAMLSKKYEKN